MNSLRVTALSRAVDAILERAGDRVICVTPLGLGKPVPLLNALYARVKAEPQRHLSILTALSLEIPRASGELERRFLDPFVKRAFAGVPDLDYLVDLRRGSLPSNIELFEFYFRPGAMLGVPYAQQNYVSSNYTHAGRDMLARGVNGVLVMVAQRAGRFSLSCNPDLTADVVQGMRARGAPCVVAALVNDHLPFMTGDAEVDENVFDVIVEAPEHSHALFGVPSPPIEPADHAIGVRAAALVKDGGTLQLGIGSLGDAVAHWLRQRHAANAEFASIAAALDMDRWKDLVAREGGLGRFASGLFASTEMFTWGLMTLFRAGVIRRRAEDSGGPVLQAAFFLGPSAFYQELKRLSDDERAAFFMTSVTRVNDLFGEESLARRQRHDARFINICMMVTLSGAAVSDGLADGRVVSGVGGQYNFVAMAHELERARSILCLRATRETGGAIESNIVFNYGHVTIPRHLRDIVITEYGIADLRGRTDAEIAAALIAIADARFQQGLVENAKAVGKLPQDWRVPPHALQNTPEHLATSLATISSSGLLPIFPLGTDFDADEQRLIPALQWLKRSASTWDGRMRLAAAFAGSAPNETEARALARMGLAAPQGLKERVLQRILALALRRTR
ncbi:MAG TPA: acetyl-CoA hydrolase/transferase C-terminal domain-containing protein [Burkholderiales bacterium]|nr:acetyl-CoA hydrolase/transferase C-terminal domain-containing protein [Burkholderiales bacterium]